MAPEVARFAEGGTDDAEREQRTGDDPGEGGRARPEVLSDGGERHGEDRDREAHGEETEEGCAEHEPRVPRALGHAILEPGLEQERPREDGDLLGAGRLDRQVL